MLRHYGTIICALMAALMFSGIAQGQIQIDDLNKFKSLNPGVRTYENSRGSISMLYGAPISQGTTPVESAANHLDEWNSLYGKDYGVLIPTVTENGNVEIGVMFDEKKGDYKFFTFRFDQHHSGIPVFRSGVGFLVRNEPGNPVVMTGFDVKTLTGFDGATAGVGPNVTPTMLKNVNELMDAEDAFAHDHGHDDHGDHDGHDDHEEAEMKSVDMPSVLESKATSKKAVPNIGKQLVALAQKAIDQAVEVSEEELVVWAGVNNQQVEPRVAVSFMAKRGSVLTYPDYDRMLVLCDAETGEILFHESQITNLTDVDGNVSGRATEGIASLECEPESAVGLPYAEVVIGGTVVNADANGDFTIPNGGTSPVTVTSYLRGTWFEVFDISAGSTTPTLTQTVTPPGPADFLHNPTNNNVLSTANVNAYYESNVVRDWVLTYQSAFPVIGTQTGFDVNTNIDDSCNAFYDGVSINFFQAGGGCNNTSFADVIYHEYGHHLINVTSNGQGQMGEGSGDCVGVLIQDEPILGSGFLGNCNAGIRNADNAIQYPCDGAIHSCGQLISGCIWDLREELIVTEPTSYQDIGSELFLGMLMVRGQVDQGNPTIDPSITVMYLELDDDDGTIGNGTPHYNEIANAFGLHNMDAPELDPFAILIPNGTPSMVSPAGGVAFTVEIEDLGEGHQSGSGTLFVDLSDGNGFQSFPMTETSAGVYDAVFPASTCGKTIQYYVSATSDQGTTLTMPSTAPAEFYSSLSGDSVTVTFSDDFQSDLGWTVSGDAGDGQWERGTPVGGGDRGDPAVDFDGSGSCLLTDNVDGNSDVDDGSTIIESPTFDATGDGAFRVGYRRWYSNTFGADPENDVFVVEVSNDNGNSWTNVETVGPAGSQVNGGWQTHSFLISDFVTPTAQMKIRFNASDLNDGSVVEAGVDAFEVIEVTCDSTICADSMTVVRGDLSAGAVTDVCESNDTKVEVDSPEVTLTNTIVECEFTGTSPTTSPSSLKVIVEASTGRQLFPVNQTIKLFNYSTNAYEQVDVRAATINNDQVVEIDATGDLSRFVDGTTNEIKVSVSYGRQRGFNLVMTAKIDQVVWEIE